MRYRPDELFRSTAPYYARYRAGYPREFFAYLVERLGLDGTQRVLDLGCGTGQIAVPLAEHVAEVIAVDPEPTMLEEGRKASAERSIDNIDWRLGDSYGLGEFDLAPLDLATMGASFHWMDRYAVLRALHAMIRLPGAVVVVSGGVPGSTEPPAWTETVATVRARWLGPQRRAGSGTYTHPQERHEDVLAQSPFSQVDTVAWTRSITRDLNSVVGLQFSYSYCAPLLLGANRDAFEVELRAALTAANPSGLFSEVIRTEAIIAVRPQR